ncbi:hypothetical protein PQD71_gp026 [Kosakonia phage Kc263]|uniref:Uncharacterized protein n=1 Tax=Kosakonia phage Kc263 TaxID=2863194 RepID=A0AAE7WF44_9CAUD|nr:hypothetical protein PQD71_gp026 [Kosakonia phage Kc263]QYN79919.1 hypothetical protein [Kosakonia phage Kc263]
MNAISQNPIKYKVKKTLIINAVDITLAGIDDPDSAGHLQLTVNCGTDGIRVAGNINRHTAMFDVVGLLKAAAIAMAKGEPKETRQIEEAFVGDFLSDYNFSLNQQVKERILAEHEKGVYWELIADVIFSITGDRPANTVYVTGLITEDTTSHITGVMLGTEVTITSTYEPDVVVTKLIQSLLRQIFGPNVGKTIDGAMIKEHINVGFSEGIIKDMSSLSAIWQTYLIENCPAEPSDAAKELAAAMQKGEHENCLTKLVDFMFDKNIAWDPEQQLQRNITGKAHGAEVQLTVIHAVGNFFVKGYIGGRRLRIYKDHSTLQIYTTDFNTDFDMDRCTKSIPVYRQAEFEEWLMRLAQRQAELEVK